MDRQDAEGNTAFQLSLIKGNLPLVKALVEEGSDPNATDKDGWTALLYASYFGHLHIVRFLMDIKGTSGSVYQGPNSIYIVPTTSQAPDAC